jgi:two-component system, OmpR family, sensor histidine kinase KdpD
VHVGTLGWHSDRTKVVTLVQPDGLTKRYRRTIQGVLVTVVGLAAVLVVLVPFRAHLSTAIPALLFVLPALIGVVVGGFFAGAVGALGGFVLYDYYFLPPYNTLTVRSPQNWIALVVYLAVVLVVAQVADQLRHARGEALRRTDEAGRLYELSQALIGDPNISQLVTHIVDTVQGVFSPRWTALILPAGGRGALAPGEVLQIAAAAGQPMSDGEIVGVTAGGGHARSLGLTAGTEPLRVSVALAVGDHAVGLLVLQDVELEERERSLLGTFANQAALALDRAELSEQALRTRLLEEIDRWRSALMGAASHDLRTPLASIKTAVSSLRQVGTQLDPADRAELLELIELQSDRLARLVTNLLDMTRIEAGALELRPIAIAFGELVSEALGSLEGIIGPERVVVEAAPDLPLLHIDHVLISQVLANVLENAERLSPERSVIRVAGRVAPGNGSTRVEIAVSDDGPGIGNDERERVFEMFSQTGGGGRAGLGLAIAKAFVEAHGGRIWVDPDVERGARVVFTVPAETLVSATV